MIDTVVLMLNRAEFEITDHDRFSPSTVNLFKPPFPRLGRGGVFKCVQNPTRQELYNGPYKPRLTAILRPCKLTGQLTASLKIEFSAPKLLHGNNFDELRECDFPELVGILVRRLKEMGVTVDPDVMCGVQVSAVHYSKNFILKDHTRCRHVLDELRKLKIWHQLDVTMRDYRNDGYVLKWHGNSYELCLYDKVKDLESARLSGKRAIDRQQEGQLDLLDDLRGNQAQVLRMETRLTKVKLKRLMADLGMKGIYTFINLFSEKISKKILTHYWNIMQTENDKSDMLRADLKAPDQYLEKLLMAYPAMKPKEAVSILGATSVLQQAGERGFEAMFGTGQQRTVRRLIKTCKARQPNGNPRWQAAKQVQEQLQGFKPVSCADLGRI